MSSPKEITGALSVVEVSAAHLERISQIHDAESRRLLYEIALALRLIAALVHIAGAETASDPATARGG